MDINLLLGDGNLSPDVARSRWKALAALPASDRLALDPGRLGDLWQTTERETLDFLWSCARAGQVRALWQVFNPATGWVLAEAASPAEWPEALTDPFDGSVVRPDLGSNVRVVFSAHEQPHASWSDYLRSRRVGAEAPTPTALRPLGAFEVGKLDLTVTEDEVYHLVCLETRSVLTLSVDSAKVTGGRSFIGKMKQYRAEKFLLSLQRRVIDVHIAADELVTDFALIAPGQLTFWVENKVGRPVCLQVWKTTLPPPRPAAAPSLLAHWSLPALRRNWAAWRLPSGFQVAYSGLVYLVADFSASGRLFHDWDDAESYRRLHAALAQVREASLARGGFAANAGSLALSAAFSRAEDALAVALELRERFTGASASLRPVLVLMAGPCLLVERDQAPWLFGYHGQLARACMGAAEEGDVWLSLGFTSSAGVKASLDATGLAVRQELLPLAGDDQMVLTYRIEASSTRPS